jgi:hypothetical protein
MDTNPADAFPAGPLPSLGTFINPFSQLNGDLANQGTASDITPSISSNVPVHAPLSEIAR